MTTKKPKYSGNIKKPFRLKGEEYNLKSKVFTTNDKKDFDKLIQMNLIIKINNDARK
jgi:hypothetical protein